MNTTIERYAVIDTGKMEFVTGTWATAVASAVKSKDKTDGDTTSTVYVPIMLESENPGLGAKIKSIDDYLMQGTADMDAAPVAVLNKVALGTGMTGTAVTQTSNFVATKNAALTKYTITITTPEWDKGLYAYDLILTLNAAATTVVKVGKVVVKYDAVV